MKSIQVYEGDGIYRGPPLLRSRRLHPVRCAGTFWNSAKPQVLAVEYVIGRQRLPLCIQLDEIRYGTLLTVVFHLTVLNRELIYSCIFHTYEIDNVGLRVLIWGEDWKQVSQNPLGS